MLTWGAALVFAPIQFIDGDGYCVVVSAPERYLTIGRADQDYRPIASMIASTS